jgi:hypothetical protein
VTCTPITIRRSVSATHRTGWRWTCRTCPPTRGRQPGGFNWDSRFIDRRYPRRYPDAWNRCVKAALLHIHVHHRAA